MRRLSDAIELRPGDVVALAPGDTRTLHHVTLTPTMRAATCFWSDGSSTSVDRWRTWTVLHPPAPDAPALPAPDPTSETDLETL